MRNKFLPILYSLGVGAGLGIFFHYLLYRLGMAVQPFIYVGF